MSCKRLKAKETLFLYGKNSVWERIKSNPRSIRNIFLGRDFSDKNVLKDIKNKKIKVRYLSKQDFFKKRNFAANQGIIAEVKSFEYVNFDDLIFDSINKNVSILCLDHIYDPQNLGSLLRTSACFG